MNDKPNTKLIIFIILSILSVFSLIRGLVVPTKFKSRVFSQPGSVIPQKTVSLTTEGLSLKRNAKKSNFSNYGRNPFIIGTSVKAGIEDAENNLKGIIWDEKLPLALINGKTVKIGDKLGPDIVIDIRKDRVILNDGIRDRELKLK